MKGESSTQAACRMEKEAFFIPREGAMKQKQEWQLKTFIVIVYKLA